jgi:uncharacterized protein DUF6785/uncharacterized protein DUF6784
MSGTPHTLISQENRAPSGPAAPARSPWLPVRPGRTLAVGLFLVALLTCFTLVTNLLYRRYLTAASLPNGALFAFVVCLGGNALVRRLRPRAALNPAELAVVFGMLYLSAPLPQAAVGETWITLPAVPAYYGRFADLRSLFPSWLLVPEPAARGFYEGVHAGAAIPWTDWLIPLAAWLVFIGGLLWSLYCLSRIFARRWIREERVNFPLMELPLELLNAAAGRSAFGRDPLMWLGFAIPAAMIVTTQLRAYYPNWPALGQQVHVRFGEEIPLHGLPWSALDGFTLSLWPLVVGISYFLNGEVAASIWGFHLLFWGQLLLLAALGFPPTGGGQDHTGFQPLQWIHHVEFGACIAIAATLLASVRKELISAWSARGSRETRGAARGFFAANVLLLLWSVAVGQGPAVMLGFLACYYVIALPLARLVAAGGLYLVDNAYTPQRLLWNLAGTQNLPAPSMTLLAGENALFGRADMSFLYFTTNDSKLARETGTERPVTAWGLLAAVVVALVGGAAVTLWLGYHHGAGSFRAWPLTWNVRGQFGELQDALSNPKPPLEYPTLAVAAGFLVGLFLVFMNRRYLWWAVSPLGFVVASSENISGQIWSSVLAGWALAAVIRKYGGLPVYRRLRPFFLGLILGDAVTYCLMALLECTLGVGAPV